MGRVWLVNTISDCSRSSSRRWVTTTAMTLGSGIFFDLGQDFTHVPGGVRTLVGPDHLFDATVHPDRAVIDPQRTIAELGQELVGMAGEDQDAGPLYQFLQPDPGLLHELGIDG